MKAVVVHEFGPPSVLQVEDVPDPVVGPGEVLIEVAAATVIFLDTVVRSGQAAADWRPELPYVPGYGVGGVVRSVGPGGDADIVGRRVVAPTMCGGYAELLVVGADQCVPIPRGLDILVATSLIADGRTAVRLTRAARPAIGDWVLVESAGGGLGSLLVQLARNAGARVIGAASTVEKRDLATKLGASFTVDYTAPGWADLVRDVTGGVGVDLVYDGVGGEVGSTAFSLVREGGRFVVHGSSSGSRTEPAPREVDDRRIELFGPEAGWENPASWLIERAFEEAARGLLEPTIGNVLRFEDASRAHAAIEHRSAIGRTLLVAKEPEENPPCTSD